MCQIASDNRLQRLHTQASHMTVIWPRLACCVANQRERDEQLSLGQFKLTHAIAILQGFAVKARFDHIFVKIDT